MRTYDHVLVVRACEHPEMLAVGEDRSAATVWRPPADAVTIGDLLADGPILLLFYLFDWTSPERRRWSSCVTGGRSSRRQA